MKQQKKTTRKNTNLSIITTTGFIVVSLLLIYAAIRLVGSFAIQELRSEPTPGVESHNTIVTATPEATPEDLPVSVVIVPAESQAPAVHTPNVPLTTTPDLGNGIEQTTPQPEETLQPAGWDWHYQAVFTEKRMDVAVLCFSPKGYLCCAALLRLDGDACTLLSVPCDLLDGNGRMLSETMTNRAALDALESAIPVTYTRFIHIETRNIAACVDTVGPLTINGTEMDGAAVAEYIGEEGLTMETYTARQEAFLYGSIQKLRMTSVLRIAAAKIIVQKGIGGNLSMAEFMQLYRALKSIPVSSVRVIPMPTYTDEKGRHIDTEKLSNLFTQLSFS